MKRPPAHLRLEHTNARWDFEVAEARLRAKQRELPPG
jgi:hypothetical protein